MPLVPGVSAFWDQPTLSDEPPPPDPDPLMRFVPSFAWNLASSLMITNGTAPQNAFALSQRNRIVDDCIDIYSASLLVGSAIHCHVSANWGWDDAEDTTAAPGKGNYVMGVGHPTSVPETLKVMVAAIRAGITSAGGTPKSMWFVKLFFRNYNFDPGASSPCVPRYMRGGATDVDLGLNGYAGETGGTGNSANGEYEGVHKGAVSRNAKMWVPEVAERFQAWVDAIGAEYNDDPTFGGVIINETSQLPACYNRLIDIPASDPIKIATGMSVPTAGASVIPTSHAATLATYFQNFFGACVDARPSLAQCELIISPNTPSTIWTATPLSPSVLAEDHAIGVYIQDGYSGKNITPKGSVQLLYENNQPMAQAFCSYSVLYSGEVSEHNAVNGSQYTSTSSLSLTTGTKDVNIGSGSKPSIAVGQFVTLLNDFNAPTTNYMTGTVVATAASGPSGYNSATGVMGVSVTAKVGTGSLSHWEVGVCTVANFMPPHTIDQIMEYAFTPFEAPWDFTPRWGTHSYAGAHYLFFQVNAATDAISDAATRYRNQVARVKATTLRANTNKPNNYPAIVT